MGLKPDWTEFRNLHLPDIKIDPNDSTQISQRVLNEHDTRKRLLNYSRKLGCEREMLLIFSKIDKMMRLCANEEERTDIGKLGAYEVYNLLGSMQNGERLYMNGQLVKVK